MKFFNSRFLRSKPGWITAAFVLLLAMFLVRPGAERLRTRITHSISMALGRQVEIGAVQLRFLPQPGFDLENFVVHDDPAFSDEPMLRADEVTAALRVSSLLRGRLEVAHLSLTEPSLNLVRNGEGHWNLEDLLERAAKTPVAPTSKPKSEARPGFPYIEAGRGRINFKIGREKTPYALTEADFSLWQDSENAWGMRLKAQPLRTDLNLTDTGLLKVNGTWQRAESLRQTPVQFSLLWDGAQLGQATKLAFGNDKGWRGTLKLAATISGMPADLTLQTDASIQDFRRYDILGGNALRMAAQCSGHYSTVDHALSQLACRAPVADGLVSVSGTIAGAPGARTYELAMTAQDVPIQSLAAFARHAKKDMPDDLVATGKLNGSLGVRRKATGTIATWTGRGEARGVRLASKTTNTDLAVDTIPFAISPQLEPGPKRENRHGSHRSAPAPAETQVEVGPFDLELGRPAPATVRGWVARSGYSLSLVGDAQVQRVLQVARTVGLPVPLYPAVGIAKVDLQISGTWQGFSAPQATGKAQLHSVRAEFPGVNTPLEIATANLQLTPDEINVENLAVTMADTSLRGSLAVQRQCGVTGKCPVRFDLHAEQITTDELSQLLNPHPRKRPWYRFLASATQPGTPYLLRLHAIGKLTANRVTVHKLVGTHVSVNAELAGGVLRLSDLRGEVLGGTHVGEWTADFTAKPPAYSGSGTFDRIALSQLADAMHDGWITGTATATYRATASGLTAPDLLASAEATLQIEARDGSLPHLVLAVAGAPLRVRRSSARLILRRGTFEIEQGKLETPAGIYHLSGTASLGRVLDLKLVRDSAHGFNVTGTLTEPRVAAATTPETQAALKP
ncbi:MAG: AsmA family protein [Acidobacteriia bacterium]|nr:AsmA family protein [Terriglobia bacterium]